MSPSAENPYVGWMSQECSRLSQIILDNYCEVSGLANLGVMVSDDMTGINWSQIPVTIIEMGFMTNPGDDSFMADEENQYVMACGIADGVDAYFGKQQTPEG